jgi:hypothetical protein
MTKIIILNGPPGCGKDTLADHFQQASMDLVWHIKFAHSLKVMTHRLYNVPNPEDVTQFELIKDTPNYQYFYGLSPREAYIQVSETYIKPTHGNDFFGVRLVELMKDIKLKSLVRCFVSSDGGLLEELYPVIEHCGSENILVIKIVRPGYDFKGDSRSYYNKDLLELEGIKLVVLQNRGTLEDFLNPGLAILKEFALGEQFVYRLLS